MRSDRLPKGIWNISLVIIKAETAAPRRNSDALNLISYSGSRAAIIIMPSIVRNMANARIHILGLLSLSSLLTTSPFVSFTNLPTRRKLVIPRTAHI